MSERKQLQNLKFEGEDINIALGLGWSKLLKFMGKSVALAKSVPSLEEIGAMALRDSKAEERMAQFKGIAAGSSLN